MADLGADLHLRLPDYPADWGTNLAPAHGVLGIAYVTSSIPSSETGGKCPCLIFATSRDEGKTFDHHVIQYDYPVQRGFGEATMAAADPSHPGRYAVANSVAGNSELQVYLTDDYGKTWKAPVHAGGTPGTTISKPDMAYSPSGQLALMWLAVKPDKTYTAWSSVSHDGGLTFSKSLHVKSGALALSAKHPVPLIIGMATISPQLLLTTITCTSFWPARTRRFPGPWYARVPLAGY